MPAADGLFGQGGRVGEHGRAAEPAELFARACGEQSTRVTFRCADFAWNGCFGRSENGADSRGGIIPWRRGSARNGGLFGQGGRVGEQGRAAEPAELFAGACGEQSTRVTFRCADVAWNGCFGRSENGADSRGGIIPWRRGSARNGGDFGEADRGSANRAGKTGRSGEARGHGSCDGIGAGRAGIPAAVRTL